jgi:hypothetical protein
VAGEGIEEGLQNIMEPVFRNIAFDEHNKVEVTEDTWYQFFIGTITEGLIEAGPTVAKNISNTQAGYGVNEAGKVEELIGRSLELNTKTEAYKLASRLADGIVRMNDYNVGELLRAYVEEGGDMAFMKTMPQTKGTSVNTAERFVETLAGLNQNAKASTEAADAVSSFVTTMQDLGSAIPAEVHDAVMAAYRTFEASGTNNSAFTMMQTALQSIDSAIMQGLVSGGDVTGLVALRSRMESGLDGSVRQSIFGSKTVNTTAMADAVTILMKLPAEVQSAIDADALSQAYFDFLTAEKNGKSAVQAKAVDVLFASVEAAIATGKLDAVTVQELQGLLVEIDSKRSVGDNKNKIGEKVAAGSKFKYKNNPMENPNAAKDIVENIDAVYGFSPKSGSSLDEYAKIIDWTNSEQVAKARAERIEYHQHLEIEKIRLEQKVNKLEKEGYIIKDIANIIVDERNESRIQTYLRNGNYKGLEAMKARNSRKYNNPSGPTAEFLFNKYGSWEEVIFAAVRSNLGMDACTGLYDLYFMEAIRNAK